MVQNQVFHIPAANGIGILPGRITKSESDLPDNHFVGINSERKTFSADPISRSRLPGDRDIGVLNPHITLQVDRSETVNTTVLGPKASTALRRLPSPESLRFVTS